VVLSGCSTAHGQLRRGEGVLSLARPFLARGVPSVVATLWDIPDTSARALFIAFHRARARGVSDLAALRSAQLAMLSSGDPSSRSPRNWASVAVYSRVRALDDPIAEQK
jgi:CHAT domain-containing protein